MSERSKRADAATEADEATGTRRGARGPRRIVVAAVLTGAEGLVVAAFGVVSLVLLVTRRPDDTTQAATLAATVLALSVLPLAAAGGLWHRRRWSRGPSMIVQLIALPVAWQLGRNGGGSLAAAVVLGLAAVVVLGCLVNPKATEALGVGRD
ncbi:MULTISPECIES: hypothetical protein [Streptomyces]|uniref:Integral membrane protein n=1 Tax=Streptomyces qinglanensis TaxID=943816 RepID=A0A1E7K902_9ACTN|nr:hypothetical protein [Streptomyces qinglanensis]OEV00399.1 hypothetical protein AN217_24240 [Streptomyces qinglanensis]OEV25613.1 hypothetical protein AN220_12790 [Streptomyces nanshensis]